MERLINSDFTITQQWSPVTLSNPEDGGEMFSETSVLTIATGYKVPEVIYTKGTQWFGRCICRRHLVKDLNVSAVQVPLRRDNRSHLPTQVRAITYL
jgi:hypothetical protein